MNKTPNNWKKNDQSEKKMNVNTLLSPYIYNKGLQLFNNRQNLGAHKNRNIFLLKTYFDITLWSNNTMMPILKSLSMPLKKRGTLIICELPLKKKNRSSTILSGSFLIYQALQKKDDFI